MKIFHFFFLQMWIYSLGITLQRALPSTLQIVKNRDELVKACQQRTMSSISKLSLYSMTSMLPLQTPSSQPPLTSLSSSAAISKKASENERNQKRNSNAAVIKTSTTSTAAEQRCSKLSELCPSRDNHQCENGEHNGLSSLDYVIASMCSFSLHHRASLMYLLDVSIQNIDIDIST